MADNFLRAFLVASLACCVLSSRLDHSKLAKLANDGASNIDIDNTQGGPFRWVDNMQLGDNILQGGPLVPALVPGPGQTFEVMNREAIDFFESNAYHWAMVSVHDEKYGDSYPGKWFAAIDGSFFGNTMGWKTTYVNNNNGMPLFKIHLTKHMWNPTRWTWSFRIAHPITDDVLFTINKDWFGSGLFMMRDEWRVYRGHKKDGEQVYYCASSLTGYEYWCYKNEQEWNNNRTARAHFSQSMVRDIVGLPDKSTLKVEAGEDTALLLSTSVIMDMVYEQEQANDRAKENAERHRQKQRDWERRHGKSSHLEVASNETTA